MGLEQRPFVGLWVTGPDDEMHRAALERMVPEALRGAFRDAVRTPEPPGVRLGRNGNRIYHLRRFGPGKSVGLEVMVTTYQSRDELLDLERELLAAASAPPAACLQVMAVLDPFDPAPSTPEIAERLAAAYRRGEHWSTVSLATIETLADSWRRLGY
ncbi:hypothetical protein E3E14_21375 [Streptomyces sp. ICN441]|uniref:hypothetical protein n=1 Tax=Streptomyces sp. ICN441 TaxID=2558286 RepID=UPI001068DA29|nr:hypothetical protein [Streptomyces sp. ICN441]TFE47353.1 hypothetical protein E3E14_21375 [Streptomyces sp. ICN441]